MTDSDQLYAAYKTAMKARDEVGVRTLRMVISDIKKIEVDERRPVTPDDVIVILKRNIKKRHEAIDAARPQNRTDIVAAETAELRLLETFMPSQLAEGDLVAVIEATIREVGAHSKKDQGKVMGALMPKVQGKADGKVVARLVGERLP